MRKLRDLIKRTAAGTATTLIRGETGTGKELVARAVHALSPRKDRPFVKIDCALCERMLEATTAVFHDNERTVAWAIFSPGDDKKVKSFAAKTGLEYPVVIDEQERLKKLFLVSSVPTAVVLDSLGFIRWMSGPDVTAKELGQVVEEATKTK
jgi:peroxiredoxin